MVRQYRKRAITDLPKPYITLRLATLQDCRRVWEWRNESLTREASFNTDHIPYEGHKRWFFNKLPSSDTRIYIFLDRAGHEIGYVRFNMLKTQAEISISVDKNERGKGYGAAAIRQSSDQILSEGSTRHVLAYVKKGNLASKAVFERAGFALVETKDMAGTQAYKMIGERVPRDLPVSGSASDQTY